MKLVGIHAPHPFGKTNKHFYKLWLILESGNSLIISARITVSDQIVLWLKLTRWLEFPKNIIHMFLPTNNIDTNWRQRSSYPRAEMQNSRAFWRESPHAWSQISKYFLL